MSARPGFAPVPAGPYSRFSMKTLRPLLGLLLGLTLSVQGFAVAASATTALPEPAAAAADSDMPCHGDASEAPAAEPCACCDGDCPDMTGCAFAQAAIATTGGIALAPAPMVDVPASGWSSKTTDPSSRLRPPIPLHA